MSARGRSPRARRRRRRGPRSPAPKSAPPNTAYAVTPTNSTTAAAVLMPSTASRARRLDGCARPVRHVVVVELDLRAEPPAHAAQHEDRRRRRRRCRAATTTRNVIQTPSFAGRGVLDLHVLADDPRLAPDLGDDPPRLHRDDRQRPRPPRRSAGTTCSCGMSRRNSQRQPVPDGEQEQQRAEPDHHVPREVHRVHLASGRPLVGRERCRDPG